MKLRENPKFKKKEPDKTSRRSFLKKTIKGIGTLLLASYIGLTPIACKKTPFTPEPPPTPPHQVTVKVDFYNHTQGIIGEKTYTGMSSQPGLIIKINDCPNTSTIDPKRIALRQENQGGGLGKLINFSRTGETNTNFPEENTTTYQAYLMNNTNHADYNLIDEWIDKGAGILRFPPNCTWHREDRDGYTGKESIINNAVSQLNNAINYSWAKYGSLNKVGSNGNFGIGYGYCSNYIGVHTGSWAGANPDNCFDEIQQLQVFLSEIFELITGTDDLNGHNTFMTITNPYDNGNLNPIGKDLFAYVFVKDSKT